MSITNFLRHLVSSTLIGALLTSPAFAGTFDTDFPNDTLATENWRTPAFRKAIDGNKLFSEWGQSATNESYSRNRLQTRNGVVSNLTNVNAIVSVSGLALANNSLNAFARVEGYFYNSSTGHPSGDLTGLVWAAVFIGDRGNGLEVWWTLAESTNSGFSTTNEATGSFGGATPPVIANNTDYFLQIAYDGNRTLTFTIADADGITNKLDVVQGGPTKAGAPVIQRAAFSTGGDFDAGGNGSAAYIAAHFDDIKITGNTVITDNFSSDALNSAIWRSDTGSAFVEQENGPLVMQIYSETPGQQRRYTTQINLQDATQSCLYTEALWHPDSNIPTPAEDRGRLRAAGYWYNDTFPGPNYDRNVGNIYAHVVIENPGGQLRAAATIWREDPDKPNGGTELLWQQFSSVPVAGKKYPMYIELDKPNKQLKLSFNGEVISYDILTEIYDVPPATQFKAIQLRIQDDNSGNGQDAEGYLRADISRVASGDSCANLYDDGGNDLLLMIPAIISGAKK